MWSPNPRHSFKYNGTLFPLRTLRQQWFLKSSVIFKKKGEIFMAVIVPSSEQWSSAIKQKAIKMYMQNGNLSLTARTLQIPFDTIQHWRYRTKWWPELQKRFQEEQDRKLASKMDKLVAKAVDKLEDRIEHGDHILDSKTGDVIQVPLKAKDLTTTVKVLADRTDVLIGRVSKDSASKEMMEDKLAKLAKEFAKFTKEKVIEGELISSEIDTVSVSEDFNDELISEVDLDETN
jgi:transposase-like protein